MKRSGLSTAKLFKAIRAQPCWVCGKTPSEVCHIRSRGARGPNTEVNCIPMCTFHHRSQHDSGWYGFTVAQPYLWNRLQTMGWYLVGTKLSHKDVKR